MDPLEVPISGVGNAKRSHFGDLMVQAHAFQTYVHNQWSIRFEHPAHWSVRVDEDSRVHIEPSEIDGAHSGVVLNIIESNGTSLEELLSELSMDSALGKEGFKVLEQDIKTLKNSSQRAVLLSEFHEDGASVISQEVIMPLGGERFLFFTARSERKAWTELHKLFAKVMRSIANAAPKRPKEVSLELSPPQESSTSSSVAPEEVEIVFGDAPAKKSTSVGSSSASSSGASGKDFSAFAAQFNKSWEFCSRKEELLEVLGDKELAMVLWVALGSNYADWITQKLPALHGKSAKQCLKTDAGKQQLKDMLLQMNSEATNILEVSQQTPAKSSSVGNEDALKEVVRLMELPAGYRDSRQWFEDLVAVVGQAYFYVTDAPYIQDNSGFNYYSVYTVLPSQHHHTRRLCLSEVVEEITNYGSGLVIDPHRQGENGPAMTSFGALWGFREEGEFIITSKLRPLVENGGPVAPMLGQPSEKILPGYARNILSRVLKEGFRMESPAVFLETIPSEACPHTLIFNLADCTTDPDQLAAWVDFLFWYMRPGYGIAVCETNRDTKDLLMKL